jgi:hypothetical protein
MDCGSFKEQQQPAVCETVGEGENKMEVEQRRERKQDYGGPLDDAASCQ